jgi:hypothetical protein
MSRLWSTCTILVLVVGLFVQCKKDPIKGWTYYYAPPPPLKIVRTTSLIKNCTAPYPVSFTQQTENLIGNVRYFWDFGDGNTSTDRNPNHIYATPGNYRIKLLVMNEISSDSTMFSLSELANSSIPVNAVFGFTHFNNNNFAPNKVLFSNTSTGANQFYWYFGDGGESNNDNPEHVFQNAGSYNVRLRGTCTNGTFNETVRQVFVNPAPRRVVIDSINLMLPRAFQSNRIYIEMYHNSILIGRTAILSRGSYPIKFRRPNDFLGGYIFDFVQFSGNEVFKFLVLRDNGADIPPDLVSEILLSSSFIQSRFYPRQYFQIEPIPFREDTFIDLYLDY